MNLAVIPSAWTSYLQTALRVMAGLLLLEHGTGKLLHFPEIPGVAEMLGPNLLHVTGAIELVGGALILVGFLTRPVAFVLAGFMAVAYFMVHYPMGFFPVNNHGELAILFCFVFLYFAAAGPGPFAVDKA